MLALRETLPFYALKLSAPNSQASLGHTQWTLNGSRPVKRKDQNFLTVISNTLDEVRHARARSSERRLSPIGLVKRPQGQGAW
jgi:hypothetical protein